MASYNYKMHCANVVIKIIKLYMNCGIIAVVVVIILNIMGYFLSTAQKHYRQTIEHNRLRLS